MKRFTSSELRLKFSEICDAIENEEEVIIEKRGQPFARLTLIKSERRESKAGSFKDMLRKPIPEDENYNHVTSDDEWAI